MSYISAIRRKGDVVVWTRTDDVRTMSLHPAPFYFYIEDPKHGKYTTMFGKKVTRLEFTNATDFNAKRAECQSSGIEMYESDIPPELKYLSSTYYNTPAPSLHVTFFDIEVDYDTELGFSTVDNPYAPVNSVSYYHAWNNRMVVHTVIPDNYEGNMDDLNQDGFLNKLREIAPFESDINIEFRFFSNEKQLLLQLLREISDSDVISGWNSELFDVPYIGARIEQELGKQKFNQLSFDGAANPKWRTVEIMGRELTTLDLSGRASFDYMVLFKKYEMNMQPSYKLESVADVIITDPKTKLPIMPKLVYEGSLAKLYRTNFIRFVRYNLRDTEILKGFEDRLGYVEIANQMYHMSTGLPAHVTGTLKLAELSTINHCHHELNGLVVPDNHIPDEDATIQGAFVLRPQIGMHKEVGAIDIKSLYPSVMRSINISPETIIGQFKDTGTDSGVESIPPNEVFSACKEIAKGSDALLSFIDDATHTTTTKSAKTWQRELRQANYAISGYGTVFDQNIEGIIPSIISNWYGKRQLLQSKKTKYKDENNIMLSNYYDKLQYVYKIKLNSFYGALTNKYFRFYDLRMGESTTGTGRLILIHQCAQVCKILDNKYTEPDVYEFESRSVGGKRITRWHCGYSDKYSVAYGDTDSTYFDTHGENDVEGVAVADYVGRECNKSFPLFMSSQFLCNTKFDSYIQTEREIVADRGIFVDKKRYILHVINEDGYVVDYIKVMGLDTKKTTMPKFMSVKLNNFISRLLKGETWNHISPDIVSLKDEIKNATDFIQYGLPKGVQRVEMYTDRWKLDGTTFLPGHVSASILYNICLADYEDTSSMQITSGMKIKVFYLKHKIGRFRSIALPVDIDQVPNWFTNTFIPLMDRDAHIIRLVDKPLGNIVKAVNEIVPSQQTLLLDDLFLF